MSKPRSQNINIYLADGNPDGIRKIYRSSNSNINLFDIPRGELARFCKMKEAADMGIYLLFGRDQRYIGQNNDLGTRLKQHDKSKPFWQRAFAVVLKPDFRTLDHLYYLEKTAIEKARSAGRFALENATAGSSHHHLHDSIRSDCENIFDEIETLLAVINRNFFEPSPAEYQDNSGEKKITGLQEEAEAKTSSLFYCRGKNADAVGYMMGKQFILKQGSLISREVQSKMVHKYPGYIKLRETWLKDGKMKLHNDSQYVLLEDCALPSASAASHIVLGKNTSSGRFVWKNEIGKTLGDAIKEVEQN